MEPKCLGQGFGKDRRERPGKYLQLNPEHPKHQCSPESRRRAIMEDRTKK